MLFERNTDLEMGEGFDASFRGGGVTRAISGSGEWSFSFIGSIEGFSSSTAFT